VQGAKEYQIFKALSEEATFGEVGNVKITKVKRREWEIENANPNFHFFNKK
jgi:hypothetical protein